MRIAVIGLVAALASVAHADDTKERAAMLFEEGRELARRANFAEACDRFAKSYELDPAPGTQVNFADCQEHLGHLALAWELFDKTAADSEKTNPVRAQYARDRASALAPRLATLVVRIGGPRLDDVTVSIAGRRVPPAVEIHQRVEPGDVEVVVSSPDRRFATTAHTTAGVETAIDVAGSGRDTLPRQRKWVIGAAVTGGTGILAISIAGVTALYAARHYHKAFARGECFETSTGEQCTPAGLEIVSAAQSRANLATGLFIAGTVLVGGAVALYVLAPRERSVELVPTVTATSVGVALDGRF